jgi:ABC-2 type transport system ATP-binding protein
MDAQVSFTLPAGVDLANLPASLEAPVPGEDRVVRLRSAGPVSSLFVLTRWAVEHELNLPDLDVRRPSLEDVYLQLTDTSKEANQ